MSWVRWGSKCDQGWPWRISKCSAAPGPCPGSSVYVWEDTNGTYACGCGEDANYFGTEEEMKAHLAEHAARGDHVPMSLYDDAAYEEANAKFQSESKRFWGDAYQGP